MLIVLTCRLSNCLGATLMLGVIGCVPAVATEFSTQQDNTEVVLAPDAYSPYAGWNFP